MNNYLILENFKTKRLSRLKKQKCPTFENSKTFAGGAALTATRIYRNGGHLTRVHKSSFMNNTSVSAELRQAEPENAPLFSDRSEPRGTEKHGFHRLEDIFSSLNAGEFRRIYCFPISRFDGFSAAALNVPQNINIKYRSFV